MIGNIFPDASHEKVGQSPSTMCRYAYKVGRDFFAIVEHALLHGVVIMDIDPKTHVRGIQKLGNLGIGNIGAQELITRSVDKDQMELRIE